MSYLLYKENNVIKLMINKVLVSLLRVKEKFVVIFYCMVIADFWYKLLEKIICLVKKIWV